MVLYTRPLSDTAHLPPHTGRLIELGAETPGENPYVAEIYKMALECKLYSRINSIEIVQKHFFSFFKLNFIVTKVNNIDMI